ncbi:acyl carrier protein [Streptomyces sp. PH10-H1]|uniref:acyl carrier protein n=1 Tax=Streptomyces sp. PH10-H1 TaxID=3046212 RepID=UPI0024BA1F89|nr:acyl carrier protein [Streptomyces sp. PH10-H1]
MVVPGSAVQEREFRGWLLEKLGQYLRRPPADIDISVPFAEYGIDSVAALSIFGDIEDAFGLYLEPTVAWDHPTVQSLARYLASESARSVTGPLAQDAPYGGPARGDPAGGDPSDPRDNPGTAGWTRTAPGGGPR